MIKEQPCTRFDFTIARRDLDRVLLALAHYSPSLDYDQGAMMLVPADG